MKKQKIKKNQIYSKLPGVDTLLSDSKVKPLLNKYPRDLVTYAIRKAVSDTRKLMSLGKGSKDSDYIYKNINSNVEKVANPGLKKVINATGVLLNTNLGRAPLGKAIFKKMEVELSGYTNLEFNLETAARGKREDIVREQFKYLTGCENAAVVNNNAGALLLSLFCFARGKEVIISRGELIEIGGSFRIPEILKASGAKMIEVGTTNRTRLKDYEDAITKNTRVILKAHKSNFVQKGFVEEVSIEELSKLAKEKGVVFIYDAGSGLIGNDKHLNLKEEPSIRTSIKQGTHLVTFSTDKLLGGPQGGGIVGSDKLVQKILKNPMMRALRVGKLTLFALSYVLRDLILNQRNQPEDIYRFFNRSSLNIKKIALRCQAQLLKKGVKSTLEKNEVECGGGTLPDIKFKSFSLRIESKVQTGAQKVKFAQIMHKELLKERTAIVSVLKQGCLTLDFFCLSEEDIPLLCESVSKSYDLCGKFCK